MSGRVHAMIRLSLWCSRLQARTIIEIHFQAQDLKRFRVFFPDLVAAETAAASDALDPVFRTEFIVLAGMALEGFDLFANGGFDINVHCRFERDI